MMVRADLLCAGKYLTGRIPTDEIKLANERMLHRCVMKRVNCSRFQNPDVLETCEIIHSRFFIYMEFI